MTDSAFDPVGPEANNDRAASFEDQLVSLSAALGWTTVCRNIDVFVGHDGQSQSRGVDVLWAIYNPHSDEREGCVGEAKVHGSQAPVSTLQDELQTLHDKFHKFNGQRTFWENAHIRESITSLGWGLLSHRTEPFDPAKAAQNLLGVELRNRQRGPNAPMIFHVGPDTLEALADCVVHAGMPSEFYWPPTARGDGAWAASCPPQQLAAGMLAYKTESGETVLWLKDTVTDKDGNAIADIAKAWRMNIDTVVASELKADDWRIVAAGWEATANRVAERQNGRIPPSVTARNLSYARLNRFDDQWPD